MKTQITDEMIDQLSAQLASKIVKYTALEVTEMINQYDATLAVMTKLLLFALAKANMANLDTLKNVCLQNNVETTLVRMVNSLNELTMLHAESLETSKGEENVEPAAKVGNGDTV